MPRTFAIPSHGQDTDPSSPRLDPAEDIWMSISRPASNLAEYEPFTTTTFSQYKRLLLDGLIDGITIHRRPSATTLGSLKAAGILPSGETLDSRIRLPHPDAWTPKQKYSVSMFWKNGEGSIVAQGVAADEEHLLRSLSQVTRSRDTFPTERQDIDVLMVSRVTTRYLQEYFKNSHTSKLTHSLDHLQRMPSDHAFPSPSRSFSAATTPEPPIPERTLRIFGGFTAVPNEVFSFPLLTVINSLQVLMTSGQLSKLGETSHSPDTTITVLQPVLDESTEQVLRTRLAATSSIQRPGSDLGKADWLVEVFIAEKSSASAASSRPLIRCRAKWMDERGLSGTLHQVAAPRHPIVAARCTFSPTDSSRSDCNSNTGLNFNSASDSGVEVDSTLELAHVPAF
ncbi:hypothetical protein JCM24511_01341 [Saitozyma sp. JCM 24511]|nr:hypothetical protein JCM24511_01341 [Saitozyma sp. JCM 24511]